MHSELRARGFTLIELMVTVAILALLAGIAYPTYTSYVKRGNRADAQSQLLRMAQAEERWRTVADQYASSPTSLVLYGASSVSPATGTVVYKISVAQVASTSYFQLEADPQTGTLNASDGALTLDSNGKKCWQKLSTSDCSSWTAH